MNIIEACQHPDLFAPWFKNRASYTAWFAFLAALFGLAMTEEQASIYRRHTGRTLLPTDPAKEAWLCIGRRGGKSFFMALVAVFLACFKSYRQYLAPGERATVLVIAADRKQARVVLRYVRAMINGIPSLKKMIERETAEGFDLSNSVTIEVGTASFRSTRGYTYGAVICDEIAFWPTGEESAAPDYEILSAIRPGMATIPTSMLICASSPYSRRGALFEAYDKWFGKDGTPLVWRATTRDMNPTIPQSLIDEELEKDRPAASAEYLAQFRSDLEQFVSRAQVEGVTSTGVRFRPFNPDFEYLAFTDPAGGSGKDAMTLAIGHREDDMIVIDLVAERTPPFSPEGVTAEFAAILHEYGLAEVWGDNYAAAYSSEAFERSGIGYFRSSAPRSRLYLEFLPILNAGRVDLLDHPKLINQFCALERSTGRGKDYVDHPPRGHDDLSNAVAGVVWFAGTRDDLAPRPIAGNYASTNEDRRAREADPFRNAYLSLMQETSS